MPSKFNDTAGSGPPKKISSHTLKLDDAQMDALKAWCEKRHWIPFDVPYARFAFRADHLKVNATAYQSGKLVVAGKGTEDFVRDVIEAEITGEARLGYDEVLHPDWFETHAGLDESGKGDFFGPVIAATVIADKAAIEAWREAGVMDSKRVADTSIVKLDRLIRGTKGVVVKTVFCGMPKYNELMRRPRANLNSLLAWQHATALEQALAEKKVPWGLLDQFSKQPLVQRELRKKGVRDFELRMRTKAEEDPVVAAASIVARAEFVRTLGGLSRKFGAPLQKGSSSPLVREQAREIIKKFGARALGDFAKLHFRTAFEVVKELGLLGELPLPEPREFAFYGRK
ncbi:MAG: ribonuclease HIII [Opitutaceae bacterium]|jgi:ribonuclease HIII|nr:ribonuclease HIII [Opitutaceae bacterium]